jgi:4-carboxymuconolactone decarboxylase
MYSSGRPLVTAATLLGQFTQVKEKIVDREMFEKGLAIRRAVLGSEYVDKALATADDFNRPMQELTTQYCWGEIWGRPGLDRRTRSIINLAMISALNRPHELKAHVKGAIANGLSKDDIREVLLQVAIYCGIPAGVDSFRVAQETFKELGI